MTDNCIFSRSETFSRTYWIKERRIRTACITVMLLVLCLGAVRTGHDRLSFSIGYSLVALDILALLYIRPKTDLDQGLEFLLFPLVCLLGIGLQLLLGGRYYDLQNALTAFAVLLAGMVCLVFVAQKHYAALIWSIVNAFSLFSAGCILVQMALYAVGIRLDKLGLISDLFFTAWEFTDSFRPSGPFCEPSAFAQFALFSLFYFLYIRRNWLAAFLLTAALLLSTSSLGLVGIALLYGIFLLRLDKLCGVSKKTKYRILAAIGITAAALIGLLAHMDVWLIRRTLAGSSIQVRLLRSIELYSLMTPLEKLFGIGMQNQANYLDFHGIILANDTYETVAGASREFAGLMGYLLCTTGIMGLSAFALPLVRLLKKSWRTAVITGLFLYISLFCSIFTQHIMVLGIALIYAAWDMEQTQAA